MEVVASLSQGRTAAAQCGFFTYKSVLVIFEPPCTIVFQYNCYMFPASLAYPQGVQSCINNRVTFISSPLRSSTVVSSSIFDVE